MKCMYVYHRDANLTDALPEAEHRWCTRHIYANWSKKWTSREMKKKFFISAWSTFPEEFKEIGGS